MDDDDETLTGCIVCRDLRQIRDAASPQRGCWEIFMAECKISMSKETSQNSPAAIFTCQSQSS